MKLQLLTLLIALFLFSCKTETKTSEWVSLFDGKTLNGWQLADENKESIRVENGSIKCSGERSHAYYVGDNYENFEFEAEVKTLEHSNSGIYFHTEFAEYGYPVKGYEVQINNTYRGPSEKHPERRKTGSIFNFRNVYYPVVKDNEWFKIRIKVVENIVEVFINERKINEYIQPNKPFRWDGSEQMLFGEGTFALQSHDPGSTTYYRNLRARHLPKGSKKEIDKQWDTIVTKLSRAGFPFVDFHIHLKGGLTIDEVVENSQKLGINYGVAPNCGLHFPVTNDSSLYAYLDNVKDSPTFKGMQAEGREWVTLFSPEAVASFDYVYTDAMTFTDRKGRRNRIWLKEEVWVDDKQVFMDDLVSKIEAIFSKEPVDIYVNPTVLPDELMPEYDELWTRERMQRVVNVLAENNIALEINARYKLPKAEMIKMAKKAGVRFSFGTNNTGRDLAQLQYCLEMIQECGIKPLDMFEIKPDSLKPVNVKGLPTEITG